MSHSDGLNGSELVGDDESDGDHNDICQANKEALCPEHDCDKGPFDRKGLQRHYDIHVPCDERCAFCNKHTVRVSQFKRHDSECQARRKNGIGFQDKVKVAKKQREALSKVASAQLSSALQSTVNSKEYPPVNSNGPNRVGRKRDQQLEGDSLPRKRGRILEGDLGTAAASYASLHADYAIANFNSPGVWPSLATPLPYSLETVISSDLSFPPRKQDPRPGGSDDTEAYLPSVDSGGTHTILEDPMAGQYEAALAQASFLSSATSLPRAPTLCVHTADGPTSYSDIYMNMQGAAPVQRAPTLCVHTADGSPVYHSASSYLSSTHTGESSASTMADHIY
ncbi:hypothetical protein B0T19DRAFT_57531 [Cercophora scortea]|uniref:Uncharacterized protein n=1 Tax=Cercophora scortea TaxID=314031 RepID=A0AAE0J4X1_9PEZI|nr:hypothetical protein B0T19DRAFT_57531 [Cercophora scortea]